VTARCCASLSSRMPAAACVVPLLLLVLRVARQLWPQPCDLENA